MKAVRKICVVTGSRAEYGLLYWLLRDIDADPLLSLELIVTGMHLAPEFGLTYQQIEQDGFRISAKVEMLLSSDSTVAVTKSVGVGVMGFADAFDRIVPDIVVVLGDRFEILAAAQAAMLAKIPIAHIHGGETSEGAYDESIRHAITKMAHLHFVAAEPYRKRVVQMGEAPERVFNVGAPGLDHLTRTPLSTRAQLEVALGIRLNTPLFLVTYHPETLGKHQPEMAMSELLGALSEFSDATILFTYPNADTGGRVLIKAIDHYVSQYPVRAKAFASLGQQKYLSLMLAADAIIGNSSSGLTEAPAFKKPTVNIGDRQKGRLKASSVLDVSEDRDQIIGAIRYALSMPFQERLSETVSVYGRGEASAAILAQLKKALPSLQKPFFDLDHDN